MAARRIPDPKAGGSNPSSLIFLQGQGPMVQRYDSRFGCERSGVRFPLGPIFLYCQKCIRSGQIQFFCRCIKNKRHQFSGKNTSLPTRWPGFDSPMAHFKPLWRSWQRVGLIILRSPVRSRSKAEDPRQSRWSGYSAFTRETRVQLPDGEFFFILKKK